MRRKKRTVHYLSAADRINYGDLLFPIIFKKIIESKNIEFYNYGLVKSNLSHFGALPTNSYKTFQKNVKKRKGNVIVGGGDVLFINWNILLAYISPTYKKLTTYRIFRRINNKFKLSHFFLNQTDNPYPFIIEKVNEVPIMYNAVGGIYRKELDQNKLEKIKNNLQNAKFISVREKETHESLKTLGISSKIIPDSAIIVSDLFSKTNLFKKSNFKPVLRDSNYLFLQLGKNLAPRNLDDFSKNLELLSKKLNLQLILCPIGLALGHEDHVVLRRLSEYSKRFHYCHPKSIYDIMALIAHSKGYIGTSLHGLITAQSYGIPFFPLNRKIRKLEGYCKNWASGIVKRPLDFEETPKIAEIIKTWDYNQAKNNLKRQKKMVYENFEIILNKIVVIGT